MSEVSLPDPTHTLRLRVEAWGGDCEAMARYHAGLREKADPTLVLLVQAHDLLKAVPTEAPALQAERALWLLVHLKSDQMRAGLARLARESAPAEVRADLARHGLSETEADWLLGTLGARLLTGHLAAMIAPVLVMRAGVPHVDAVELVLAELRQAYPDGGEFSVAVADHLRVNPLRGLVTAAGKHALERGKRMAVALGYTDAAIAEGMREMDAYTDRAQAEVLNPAHQARAAETDPRGHGRRAAAWDQVVSDLWAALAHPRPRTSDEERHGVGLRDVIERAERDADKRRHRSRSDGGRSEADLVAEAPEGDTRQGGEPDPADEVERREMLEVLRTTADRVLTARQRDVILMRYGGTRATWPEVATALGVTERTARRDAADALDSLRNAIRPRE